ncbi:Uroporphyrinogen-III methyltransferase [Oceanococcus atlanticus]|uniref:Siroheme synthase n=1 Tax=Oceanococcus atlanticus TaxID=1317117 RepID=A0A1Y1SFI6_9GAMM|nr:Uroporphyrinogen-III methyltransferase [Oceanococcus atlanticus]
MEFFPVFMRLVSRDVLVVGGGEIAARKVRLLHKGQARIRVVAPQLCAELAEQQRNGQVSWLQQPFDADAFGQPTLVIAATDQPEVNRQVASVAQARGVPVNVVDDAQSSTAIMPSIVDRSPVVVALSSGGTAPVLARRLRDQIEKSLPSGYGRLAALSGAIRERVMQTLPEPRSRLRFWERVFDGPVAQRAVSGDLDSARAMLDDSLRQAQDADMPQGEVFLVGVGPGDPDLLTLRAHRLMQLADVVLYDRLIPEPIMDLVRRDAERIDVGKRRSNHTLPQEDINALLVRLARQGQRVLRLKGGDPFMFGRGGEEIEELMEAGVPFQVVPGITSALGCAAYAGIPLTHRDHAQSCVFVTGHPKADGTLDLDWPRLAHAQQTLVVYMGVGSLPALCAELIRAGLAADWPAALIFNGTRPDQQVITGQLDNLPQRVEAAGDITGPGLLIVGQVVRLRERCDWLQATRMA